jgi:hypothetical protein
MDFTRAISYMLLFACVMLRMVYEMEKTSKTGNALNKHRAWWRRNRKQYE